jgi:hypothetical protein
MEVLYLPEREIVHPPAKPCLPKNKIIWTKLLTCSLRRNISRTF